MQGRRIRTEMLTALEQRLADARDAVATAEADVAECEELIALLKRDRPDVQSIRSEELSQVQGGTGPYADMKIVPAAVKFLRTVDEPQSGKRIAEELACGGFSFRTATPAASVHALLKKEKDRGGLVDSEKRGKRAYWFLRRQIAVPPFD